MNISTPELTWWQLTDQERERLEQVIDHVIFQKLNGNREAVIDLINTARRLGYDADPLVAAILWILSEKVYQDD
jgi:hypothetical protein